MDQSRVDTCIDPLIICYVCEPHTHIIRDYKKCNPPVKREIDSTIVYACDSHT